MKTRVIKASELTPRTLLARDYVLRAYEITYVEETETDVIVHLDADTPEEARTQMDEMSDEEFIQFMKKGKRTGFRVVDREVTDVVSKKGE